ncbi:kinase-like domain-containing protein [Chytridium lagenaria]|nr:kinase-like domain-containing protein [Chytridium lagenaria]
MASVVSAAQTSPNPSIHQQQKTAKPVKGATKDDNIVGNYRIDKTIGQGTYGKVKLGFNITTNEKVAVKVIEKSQIQSPKQVARLQREIRFLKLLYHPHIVKVHDVIETDDFIYIVMEYAAGGELFDYIVAHKRVKENEAREFFRMVLSAVDYCHKNAVIHRDLKPENLLLDDRKSIKIIDFGFGNNFTMDGLLDTFCGSPFYAAPEMILGKKYEGPEVDMWSLGVILFALLCGHLPFDDEDMKELYKKIASGTYTCPDYLLPNARHLISRLITVDPKKRATLHEVLLHPWVNEGHKHPPYNYLPQRETTLTNLNLSRDLVNRLKAFGHKEDDIQKAFAPTADRDRPDAIRSTYFLLKEMLEREEVRMQQDAQKEADAKAKLEAMKRPPPPKESLPAPPASVARPVSLKHSGRWGSDATGMDGSANTLNDGWRDSAQDVHSNARFQQPSRTPNVGYPIVGRVTPPINAVATHYRSAVGGGHPAQLSANSKQQFRSLQVLATDRRNGGSTRDEVDEELDLGSVDARRQGGVTASADACLDGVDIDDEEMGRRYHHLKVQSELQRPPPIASSLSSRVARLSLGSGTAQQDSSLPYYTSSSPRASESQYPDPSSSPQRDSQYQTQRSSTTTRPTVSAPTSPTSHNATLDSPDLPDTPTSSTLDISSKSSTQPSALPKCNPHAQIRTVSGWFLNVNNTSSRPAPAVLVELQRILSSCRGVRYTIDPSCAYTLQIEVDVQAFLGASQTQEAGEGYNVMFQIEICRIPRINMCGLHFRRVAGGVWNYKKVCNKLLGMMTL